MKRTFSIPRTLFAVAMALTASFSALPASADYQFIVSGYPAENPKSALASTGTAVATSMQSAGSAAQPLEARFRSWFSAVIEKINTFPPTGFLLILR